METPTNEISALPLHDALPISLAVSGAGTALAQATVTAAGQLIAGGRLSRSEKHTAELQSRPHVACRRLLGVNVNWLTQLLALMLSPTKLITGVPPQVSLAVTLAVSGAGTALAQATVTAAGQLIAGCRLSLTVIVFVQGWLMPQASVAP